MDWNNSTELYRKGIILSISIMPAYAILAFSKGDLIFKIEGLNLLIYILIVSGVLYVTFSACFYISTFFQMLIKKKSLKKVIRLLQKNYEEDLNFVFNFVFPVTAVLLTVFIYLQYKIQPEISIEVLAFQALIFMGGFGMGFGRSTKITDLDSK